MKQLGRRAVRVNINDKSGVRCDVNFWINHISSCIFSLKVHSIVVVCHFQIII